MFFHAQYSQFFRPLTSKYRAQVVECLRVLYLRVYSSLADYSQTLDRQQVIELFQDAVTRTPLMEDEEDDADMPVRGDREQAGWVLNTLRDSGWLEIQMDSASMQSVYAFTRMGRLFTQPFIETESRFRTRHRNTRNTRNALQSFIDASVEDLEVYDLLDAFEHSERIVSDFTDVIAELDDRKRQLAREVESRQLVEEASEVFFEFMEKRFMPDLAVRLSADSVEKYRDDIQQLIAKAKRKHRDFQARAERELRKLVPDLLDNPKASYYFYVLDGISARLHSACEVMLPALRKALHGFTRRADIIIRQLSFTHSGEQSPILEVCKALQALSPEQQNRRLQQAGQAASSLGVGLIDPAWNKLYNRRRAVVVNTRVEERAPMSASERRELFIRQAMEQAFAVNSQAQRDYLLDALNAGQRVRSTDLPIRNARELLHAAHIIEVATAGNSSEQRFRVIDEQRREDREYFTTDVFTLELEG